MSEEKKIATGASKWYEADWPRHKSVAYKINCGCGDSGCDASLHFEHDDGIATLEIYKTMWIHENNRATYDLEEALKALDDLNDAREDDKDKFVEPKVTYKNIIKHWILKVFPCHIRVLWGRIKIAAEVLWTGHYEIEGGITITNMEHLKGMHQAIGEGITAMDKWQKEWQEKDSDKET